MFYFQVAFSDILMEQHDLCSPMIGRLLIALLASWQLIYVTKVVMMATTVTVGKSIEVQASCFRSLWLAIAVGNDHNRLVSNLKL